jgi:radical SAM protein with 4Fe4S-binding SPASM domain
MDKYRIDSHKLMFHVSRVNDWLNGKTIYPIYMEVSPAGSCNHRCIYCGLDFMEYRPKFLEAGVFKKSLVEMGKCGVKSIMYAGEGEPFLHKNIAEITRATKSAGIDAAFTTNGALFNKKLAEKILPYASWIKVSINAGTPAVYEKIHRCAKGDFERVLENMSYAAELRNKKQYKCALGMQIILLPQNSGELELLAKKAKDIGMDYLVVKPYSQHPQSKTRLFKDIKYNKYYDMADSLSRYNDKDFHVVFRIHAMRKWDDAEKGYKHCLALPFWSYIDSDGNVWACSIYLTDKKFIIGNIYKDSFKRMYKSEKYKNFITRSAKTLDTSKCRVNCRMDEVNRYLWELKNPSEHVNFI